MTIATPKARFTPDDVLNLEEDGLYELVDGDLVEKEMSELANETVTVVSFHVFSHVRAHRLGKLYTEQSYQCFPKGR